MRDRINAGIVRVLLRRSDWPAPDSGARSVDEYVKTFFKGCGPSDNHALYERKTVTFLRSTAPVISLQCLATADGGGVHPFGTTFYINFESETGKAVRLIDILKPGALAQLASLAESRLREEYKLSTTERLSEHGFGFPGDQFKLNDNYGIGDNALVFHFNTYEIGPGAMGDTKIEITYVDMRHLLKPGSGLLR